MDEAVAQLIPVNKGIVSQGSHYELQYDANTGQQRDENGGDEIARKLLLKIGIHPAIHEPFLNSHSSLFIWRREEEK